jgi:hypothetical protein
MKMLVDRGERAATAKLMNVCGIQKKYYGGGIFGREHRYFIWMKILSPHGNQTQMSGMVVRANLKHSGLPSQVEHSFPS